MPTIADNEKIIFDVHNCNQATLLKLDDAESESDSELVDIIRTVTNSHDVFHYQNNNNSQNETRKGIWHYLTSYLPWNKEVAIEDDREFNMIMEEGRALHHEAESLSAQLRQMDEPRPPGFSLKTKAGLLMGTALVFAGSGIGFYLRRSTTNNDHNHSSENYYDEKTVEKKVEKTTVSTRDIFPVYGKLKNLSLQLKSNSKGNNHHDNENIKFRSLEDFPFLPANYTYTEEQPEICKTDKFHQDCQKTHLRLLENKSDVFKRLIINIAGINCFCPPLKGLLVHFISPVVSTSTILPAPPSPPTTTEPTTRLPSPPTTADPTTRQSRPPTTAEPTTRPPRPPTTAEPTTQRPSLPAKSEPTSLKPLSPSVDINKQQINDQTIPRCRTRLIGYINSHLNVPSRVNNKELAKLAIHLLFLSPYHEARIAQIYLYGTGYFGEMDHEIIDVNIQHQLVGDLLSKLIHGKSLEEYLVYSFSINRYISIENYKNNIIKENAPVIPNINSEKVNLFYDRYIVPALPFLSTKIIRHSEILVGSITWFFIHLASCFAGEEESLYKESTAISKGLEVLNYFIDGKLSEGSQYRFYMGLKFNFLFSVQNATVDTIPEFEYLWNEFREQLIKRIKFSELFHLTAKDIVKSKENIADKPWDSKHEFTSYILNKYCPAKKYNIYHRENKETTSISEREYSDVKGGDVWCVYLDKNKKAFEGTLPIINTEYKNLLENVLNHVANSSRLFIESAFRCSDYFNPKMEGDDFFFIDKSALELVLINLNEPRQPVEKLIGPPLKKIHTKIKYYFFRASYHGEQRLYAIDHGSKYLIQRVKIDKQKLKESIGVFFNDWSSYPDNLLTVTIYADKKDAISISEKEPTEVFIKKIVNKKFEEANQFIELHISEDLTLQQEVIEFIKELLIPFYSCIKSLNGWSVSDAFLNCFFDGVFLLFPLGNKALSTTRKVSEKFIDISFLIKSNQVFKKEGSFLWRKISNDVYIYNTIINEQYLLKNAIIEMLLSSIDPGLGLLKEIKNTAYSTAMVIMRGGLIKLSLLSIRQFQNLSEFFIRTKSISESTKKLVVKVSKSSGRLSSQHPDDNENSAFNSLSYGIAYQYGDYYAFLSVKGQVDTILGISDETTENEENIYIILEGEELNGVLFRCICRKTPLSSCDITPWFSPETKREKIIFSETVSSVNGDEFVFNPGALNNFNQFVFYPDYQCILSQDGAEKSKFFNIFKINGVYYVFDADNKYLRILYDGDMIDVVDVKNGDENMPFYYINKNGKGDLIVSRDSSSTSDGKTFLNTNYSPGGYFPFMASDTIHHKMTLHYLSDKLLLNVRERYLELGMLPIKNQFIITDKLGVLPSFIIGWHSLDNTFSTAKPYFKRNSPHIGMNLEDIIKKNCRSGDKLKYYPTLLLSGMMSSRFDTKLRILGSYHPIGQAVNQLFPLECKKSNSSDRYWLYYDLFTESFELVSKQSTIEPPKDRSVSPYETLIDQIFSVGNFPDITEIINIQGALYNHTLSMRLRQAAFLKRLNPIDRMETLALPLVQVYSWVLHSDVLLFQKKYPAAALWITWQRQVGPLLVSKSLTRLPRAIKVNMENSAKKNYTNGMLINGQYTVHEAIWVSHNEIESRLILRAAEKKYFEEEPVPENNEMDWLPKAKYSSSITVTQFMYEKNIHPEVVINKKYNNIHVANCYSGDGYIERNPAGLAIDHIIINHNGKWLATIDSQRNLLIYDLSQMESMYTKNAIFERVFQITRFLRLDKNVTNNYALLILNDEGELYYPRGNMWVENNGNGALWSPPMNYFPAFVSQDQRFLGFKHQSEFTVILYDQKRELMRQLQRPVEQRNIGNLISVAFSALNAVIALAFDDGNVYLYDLICERPDKTLNPIAHIELDKINDKKIYDNILMRFEDFFYTLTIIHPGYVIETDVQKKETGYIRSIYSFYHDDSSE